MKLAIATANLQSAVGAGRSYLHYIAAGWRYWLPHSDAPIRACGETFAREGVDVACIQEISEDSLRTGWRSQTEALAESAAMANRHFYLVSKFDGLAKEGNAIVSRHPLQDIRQHPLSGGILQSALCEARISPEGMDIAVFAAHISVAKSLRRKQLKEIADLVKDVKGPAILAGDFNETDPAAFDELQKTTPFTQMCSLPTYPSWKPSRPLDYVFLSEHFKVLDCYIPKGKSFSDHAAMIVRAEL